MATRNANIGKSVDWVTIVLYAILVVCGWFSICGASYDFTNHDFFSFATRPGKQLVWIGCATLLGIVLLNIEKKYYELLAYPVYVAFIVLLVVTIFIAPDTKGSHSWLVFGPVKVQPAEFAKFATALALGKLMSSYNYSIGKRSDFIKTLAIIVLPMLLIVAQSETGSALVYLAFFLVLYREGMTGSLLLVGVCAVVFFVLGISLGGKTFTDMPVDTGMFVVLLLVPLITALMLSIYAHDGRRAAVVLLSALGATLAAYLTSRFFVPFNICIVQIIVCVLIFLYLLIVYAVERMPRYVLIGIFALGSVGYYYSCDYVFNNVLEDYQQARIRVTLGVDVDDKGVGYNVNQSKIAIGSGGLFGKGFLKGTQTKLDYVPEQATDFIFCTIGEEKGFVGSVAVLLLFGAFILRLLVLAERQGTNRFARIYGYSIVCILTLHLLINIGMVLGLTPVIGIPLPFFSYGGSSLWGFTIMIAIFLRMDAERSVR
ncbi:MAG: rod shape-determining protein RodA [Bacteroidaceae bacterium]|nr:rod shape-determining protein RodA [Bacteroidaceae bacterium]